MLTLATSVVFLFTWSLLMSLPVHTLGGTGVRCTRWAFPPFAVEGNILLWIDRLAHSHQDQCIGARTRPRIPSDSPWVSVPQLLTLHCHPELVCPETPLCAYLVCGDLFQFALLPQEGVSVTRRIISVLCGWR